MKYKIQFSTILFLLLINVTSAQFIGKPGVYYLGGADIPISEAKYSNPNISGVVCRFRWETLESSPGNFNWEFIDNEILKAKNAGKKISLQPLGRPMWIVDSLHAQPYYYIDKNQYHQTYGEILSGILPWDSVYIERLKIFIQNLAEKYAEDTTVTYTNMIAGHISRNLPDTVITDTTLKAKEPFWTIFDYNADSLAVLMDSMIVFYMNLFPNTPLWCSVDYVRFEPKATGRPFNYLASLYTDFGLENYPDRFGLFREDLSACTRFENIDEGWHWNILKNNPCRTGAQMLWNVQDGPSRMNQCGILPNTKQVVLDSAVQKGIDFGMRYIEIYGIDIDDSSLEASIANANQKLIEKAKDCAGISGTPAALNKKDFELVCYPNPVQNSLTVKMNQKFSLGIYDITGRMYYFNKSNFDLTEIDCSAFPSGIYFLRTISEQNKVIVRKILKN